MGESPTKIENVDKIKNDEIKDEPSVQLDLNEMIKKEILNEGEILIIFSICSLALIIVNELKIIDFSFLIVLKL